MFGKQTAFFILPPDEKMNPEERARLIAAYLKTNYIIETPAGEITARVGETNQPLDELLANRAAETWAFVTAYNPRSQQLTKRENEARQQKLCESLAKADLKFLKGRGEGADWTPEPSVFIFDIELERAARIARRFEQNAIVFGRINKPAELVWCD